MVQVTDILQYAAIAFMLYFVYNMWDSSESITKALKDPRTVLLDARSSSEFAADGIPKSINIPHTAIEARQSILPKDKSTPIVAYCASGNRVRTAISSLQALGYTNVLNGRSIGRVAGLLAVAQGGN